MVYQNGFSSNLGETNPATGAWWRPGTARRDIFQRPEFRSQTLADDPRLPFFAALGRAGTTPTQKRYFQNQFQNIHNRFLGMQGQQIEQGQMPTQSFGDFLGNDFDFGREFQSQPPSFRGEFLSRFSPRSRFIRF